MRSIMNSLILISVLAGAVARADVPGGDVVGTPRIGPDGSVTGARKTALKFHPLPAIGGPLLGVFMLPLELEFAVSPNLSVYAIGSPLVLLSGAGGGVALNGGVRGYFSGNAPDGFWLGGQVGVTTLGTSYGSVTSVDLQPQIGYQWVFDGGFTIGVGVGLSVSQLAAGQPPMTFTLPMGIAW
jgi:hypothetical protein